MVMRKDGFEEVQGHFDADFDAFTGDGYNAIGRLKASCPTLVGWRASSLEPFSIQLELAESPVARRLCSYFTESNQSHDPRPKPISALTA